MKKSKLLLLLSVLSLTSCSDIIQEMGTPQKATVEKSSSTSYNNSAVVTRQNLENIIAEHQQNSKTRSSSNPSYTIQTINNDLGQAAIYVINFENNKGYILVSATKDYFPILAHSDKGNFNIEGDMPDAINYWITEWKENIAYTENLPKDSTYLFRVIWSKYEDSVLPQAITRSSQTDLDRYVMDMISQWARDGIKYYPLASASSVLPSSLYNEWCSLAAGATYPSYEDFMNYSFVTVETIDNSTVKELDFPMRWSQRVGYNAKFDLINGELPPAGCLPIAMAQIMRYHRYPTHYNWDDMPYDKATSTTASFIREIADNIHAIPTLEGTSAHLSDAKNAFIKNYGYSPSLQIIKHSPTRAMEEIDNNRPILMKGANSETAHAWIASGYKHTFFHTVYHLWVPTNSAESTNPYQDINQHSTDYFDILEMYLNMGWVEQHFNGYYVDSSIKTSTNETFNERREDIVNIIPSR